MNGDRLHLGAIMSFTVDGDRREMQAPDGAPTVTQLLRLWHEGMLVVVHPDPANCFTKAQAAWAMDYKPSRSCGRCGVAALRLGVGESDAGQWLARDEMWRSCANDPPTLPGEVVVVR